VRPAIIAVMAPTITIPATASLKAPRRRWFVGRPTFLLLGLGFAWGLQYPLAKVVDETGLGAFGNLLVVHAAVVAILFAAVFYLGRVVRGRTFSHCAHTLLSPTANAMNGSGTQCDHRSARWPARENRSDR
jgi:hypothetical protein